MDDKLFRRTLRGTDQIAYRLQHGGVCSQSGAMYIQKGKFESSGLRAVRIVSILQP